jgi:hypothetical protein
MSWQRGRRSEIYINHQKLIYSRYILKRGMEITNCEYIDCKELNVFIVEKHSNKNLMES